MAGLKHLILVECKAPVSFFGYPGRRSELAPEDCTIHTLASVEEDGAEALRLLAREFGVESLTIPSPSHSKPSYSSADALSPDTIGRVLAHLLPDNAIVSDETVSSAGAILPHLTSAAAHDLLPVTGGSIGQGLPVAVGAAIACPDRKVIALEADGSAMYSMQALWTMAREGLDVTVVILANRRYRILDIEMSRTGAGPVGPRADRMLDLRHPEPDWVKLSEGFGVPAVRVDTVEAFAREFGVSVRGTGPRLIEAVLD